MINRSLIRIKTVQILYSYLLTRTDFQLQDAPASGETSRDSQFAYSVYLDFICLLMKLSGINLGQASGITIDVENGLKKNKVAQAMREDASVNALLSRRRENLSKFDSCLNDILDNIYASAIYNDIKRKRKLSMSDDIKFWTTVFSTIIRKHKGVERALRRDEDFTHLGFDNGVKMFIDTLSSFDDTRAAYFNARKNLDKSLTLAYSLYVGLLYLPILLTKVQEQRLEAGKNKYLPTAEDLNPDLRFVNNLFVKELNDNTEIKEYFDEHPEANPENWRDSDLMFENLLDKITSSELYAQYMESPAGDFATDAHFWREVMRTIVMPSDELVECLESQSVYWNDDLNIMGTFVLKTIRRSYANTSNENVEADEPEEDATEPQAQQSPITLLPKFMNHDDEQFGEELFELVVDKQQEYRSYIDRFIDTKQWDTERMAFMDIVILLTAIAEIINYPSIPVPVTMNEYIEIANDYSTARSGQFVNGILYSVIKYLNDEKIISKK